MLQRFLVCAVLALTAPWAAGAQAPTTPPSGTTGLEFHVSFDPLLQSRPYAGRVYVVLSAKPGREPRHLIMNWFDPPQVFAVDLNRHDPSKPARFTSQALAYPSSMEHLRPADYSIQAIARRNLDHPVPGRGAGDMYSDTMTTSLDPADSRAFELRLTNVVKEQPFGETDRVKLVEIESALLSKFHQRKFKIRAGVVLPEGWGENPDQTYPVLYWIGGFGGNHRFAHRVSKMAQWMGATELSDQVLQVVPDPSCHRGHSVFADSANNGPWGKALVEELIPEVEKRFRGAQSGEHRYVIGISSGGWSSLWLQLAYPDSFAGCWAHVPDPVDFRDFQRINLYAPDTNMYVDGDGAKRALARGRNGVVLEYEDFVRMEEVLGPGGQIHSFEAVFSQRGPDGLPRSLFDRATGQIDHQVATSWERYDIRLVLERNWKQLGPKLRGKLHVYAGERDTFYLEGAVALLKESLAKLGSDAEVEVVPGMSHTIHREKVGPMYRQIVDHFRDARSASSTPSE